jgi:hypothetical protein
MQHECKLSETQTGLNFLGRLVATCNWITFISFLGSEIIFFRREAYLISHFNDDDAAPYNQLPTFITDAEHNHVLGSLRRHNKLARTTAIGLLSMCTFNLILSCLILLTPPERGGRYNGLRTLVSLVSNVLLLARRVVQNARISNLSFQEDLALSLYQMKFRSFNDLRGRNKKPVEEEQEEQDAMNGTTLGPLSPLMMGVAQLKASGSFGNLDAADTGHTRGHSRGLSSESLSGWEPLASPHGVVAGHANGGSAPAAPAAGAPRMSGDGRPSGSAPAHGVVETRGTQLLARGGAFAATLPPPPPSPPDAVAAAGSFL